MACDPILTVYRVPTVARAPRPPVSAVDVAPVDRLFEYRRLDTILEMPHLAGSAILPAPVRYVPLSYDHTDSNTSARRLIVTLLPDWAHDEGSIGFVTFTNGITNTLLKASLHRPGATEEELDHEAVLLRAYGAGTDVLIDRECRSHSLLSQHHLAPPLLARFANGLLYKFVRGRVCSASDLARPPVWRAVARRLGEWHAVLPVGPGASGPGEHVVTAPGAMPVTNGVGTGRVELNGRVVPNLWTVMHQWIQALPTTTEAARKRKTTLEREGSRLMGDLGALDGLGQDGVGIRPPGRISVLVFGHCDLLGGNIIIHPPPLGTTSKADVETVSFIDYEYATPSPAAFDIANFFAEWAGLECNYGALPTRSQRRAFLREYLCAFAHHSATRLDEEAELRRLFNHVDQFRGLPGFYWSIWALIQATISHIEFDYASYAEARLAEYWAWRGETDGTRGPDCDMPLRERRWAMEA
ncbi:MAG: hypothetical protein M1838_005124 [Thelocarpon superellum]|nr:MAG: hypothetical protein M1838_005124 [Thelocarpon superellum]